MKQTQRHIFRPSWVEHPAVRSSEQLTRGERAADTIRNGMGSWGFVFTALLFLAGWMLGNRNVGFDKYPFILLNLILSCLAAMQGAILLIASKRQDQISSELAQHDHEVNLEADEIVKRIHTLTCEIHAVTTELRNHIVATAPGAASAATSSTIEPSK
jgi:uncharacterized membrane protein